MRATRSGVTQQQSVITLQIMSYRESESMEIVRPRIKGHERGNDRRRILPTRNMQNDNNVEKWLLFNWSLKCNMSGLSGPTKNVNVAAYIACKIQPSPLYKIKVQRGDNPSYI